jgi:hypothetical protein
LCPPGPSCPCRRPAATWRSRSGAGRRTSSWCRRPTGGASHMSRYSSLLRNSAIVLRITCKNDLSSVQIRFVSSPAPC